MARSSCPLPQGAHRACLNGVIWEQRRRQRVELFVVGCLALGFLLWFAWPRIWSASANARLVGAFSTDEEAHLRLLKQAIDGQTFRLGYIQYGHAYLNIGLLPLVILSFFLDVTEQQIIVWLRVIPILFAAATVAVTFAMTRRYLGRLAAWVASLFLSATVFVFLRMSSMSHADVPQLFFLLLGIFYCCRAAEEQKAAWLVWASASAGLAFGCKYAGLLLLPVVMLVGALLTSNLEPSQIRLDRVRVVTLCRLALASVGIALLVSAVVAIPYAAGEYVGAEYFGVSLTELLSTLQVLFIIVSALMMTLAAVAGLWRRIGERARLVLMIKQGIVWVLAFSLAFVLSSPSSVFTVRSSFVRGLLYESLHNSFGHNFEATTDRLGWLRILSSTDVLNPLVLSLAILGLALAVCRIARHGRDELLSPETIISTWSVLYLAFLISSAKVLTLRALLPVVPSLLVLAIATLCRVLSFAARRLPRIPATALTPAVLAAFIGLQLVLSGPRLLQYRQSSITREEDSEAVAIGEWLATRYAHEARVLYDPYTYVPPVFRDAHVTPWGGTLDMLAALQPDIVLVNELTSEQFSDPLRAGTYARDEELFMAKLDYYESLKKGTGGYELVRNSGAIRVYVRH